MSSEDIVVKEINKLFSTIAEIRMELDSLTQTMKKKNELSTVYQRVAHLYSKCKHHFVVGVPIPVLESMYLSEYNRFIVEDIYDETRQFIGFYGYMKRQPQTAIFNQYNDSNTLMRWVLIYDEKEGFDSQMKQIDQLEFKCNELQIYFPSI